MKRPFIAMAILALAAPFWTLAADARILSVRPIDDLPGMIIPAPPQALDSVVAASGHMLGFDERQNVLLEQDLKVDGGTIPKGTRVSSHMILLNLPDDLGSLQEDISNLPDDLSGSDFPTERFFGNRAENEWLFSGPILGVMSDTDGSLEAASTRILGAPRTSYPEGPFPFRGFEERDGYKGVGTTRLHVWMWVVQPGDWIRVITGSQPIAQHPSVPGAPPQIAAETSSRATR